ncbi:TonB-dependent receptor [Croceibacterium sp. LX-88]|uniref:TonB-dependent receptor n=1 Tax=Croceibacterium selenioxidans TaxID=2838833 RepID=A0ABS5W4M9_9SPHN|nr:TonB-dependent receptor [Croceibacterium selenioxidans]
MNIQTRLRGAAAPIAISIALLSHPVLAQDEASAEQPPADVRPPESGQAVSAGDEGTIVVTGSRIRRSEFTSPDPVTLIDPDIAQARGQFSTADMLQSSPIAAGSAQITSVISGAFVTDGGVGAETISLRGLGANRTLVLLNSRRAGPAGTRGAVSAFDLNVLPQSIVQQVEILKTGASSIYGSDAVAGVVNLITKTDTDGLELDAFVSAPFDSGGEEFRISGTWGKNFGNGHILASLDYNRESFLQRKDRDYLGCPEEYIFDEQGNRADIIDPRTGKPRCNDTLWGHVWVYDYDFNQAGIYQPDYGDNLGQYISPNIPTGQPADPTWGLTVPAGFYRVSHTSTYPLTQDQTHDALSVQNVFHPFMLNETLQPKQERFTAYLDGAWNIDDSTEVGFELLYNKRKTETESYRQFYYLTGFTNDFGPLAPGFGDPFSPGWEGPWFISPTAITDHFGTRIDVDYTRGVAWIDGQFGWLKDWGYNGYVQYSHSDGTYETDIIYADAVDLHDFRTSSCVGVTLAAGQPCVDINWTDPEFLRGNLTAEQRRMLFGVDVGSTVYDQWVGEFSVDGPLFELPYGEVQAALGVSGRHDSINDTPGEQTRNGNSWGLTSAGITAGNSKTWEAFGEVEIPVLRDIPGIQAFTLSASGRVTNVTATRASDGESDTDNGNWTYSVGANWEVTEWLQFRARYGTSFRAPALYELFLADQTSFRTQRQVDPCINLDDALAAGSVSQRVYDNCRAGIPGLLPAMPGNHSGAGVGVEVSTGGGLGLLDPETSSAKTASIILRPEFDFLPDTKFNVALDYYDIKIKGEIATLAASEIVNGCYNSEFFPDEPLCQLFTRYPTGVSGELNVNTVAARFINVNSQRNEGIDLTVDITQEIGQYGSLQLTSQMNWQLRDEIELFDGNLTDDNGEVGEPKWVGDFVLMWRSPDQTWRVLYGLDVIGKSDNEQDYIDVNGSLCRRFRGYNVVNGVNEPVCVDVTAEATFYHTLSVQKEFGNFTLSGGVANLFDTKPPRVTVAGSNSLNSGVIATVGQAPYASQYDYFGRRAFLSVKAEF